MPDKVISLVEKRAAEDDEHMQDMLSRLRKAMALVKAGRMLDVAIIGTAMDGGAYNLVSSSNNGYARIGAIEMMLFDIKRGMSPSRPLTDEENKEDDEDEDD